MLGRREGTVVVVTSGCAVAGLPGKGWTTGSEVLVGAGPGAGAAGRGLCYVPGSGSAKLSSVLPIT